LTTLTESNFVVALCSVVDKQMRLYSSALLQLIKVQPQ